MADRSMIFAALAASLLVACGAQPSDGAGSATEDAEVVAAPAPAPTATVAAPRPMSSPAPAANEKFDAYWQRFRAAALAGDAAGVAAASAPEVTSHGILDSDPIATLSPQEVPAIVAGLLASEEPIDPTGRTLRQVLGDAAAPQRDGQPLGFRRVGPLTFQQIKGRWYLTEVYPEE
ncbi:hypothetical protein ACBY01_04620 [Sphingomonas sp. ac-8]|uniref:hypothetical protein n=1 Tax=Sphingomonas sp. ac-8 TaxID=3242977 RepID=UPI003A7F70A5